MYFLDSGKLAMLTHVRANPLMEAKIHGYKNNVQIYTNVPMVGRVENALVECDFAGYAPRDLAGFTDPLIVGDHLGDTHSPDLVFTAAMPIAPQTCYGVFVTIKDYAGVVRKLFAGRFHDPQTITHDGDTVIFRMSIFDDSMHYVTSP